MRVEGSFTATRLVARVDGYLSGGRNDLNDTSTTHSSKPDSEMNGGPGFYQPESSDSV